MPDMTAGEVIVKIIADTTGLRDGIADANKQLDKFGGVAKDASSDVQALDTEMDTTADTLKKVLQPVKDNTTALEKNADAAQKAADSQKKQGDETGKAGEKSKKSKGFFKDLSDDIKGLSIAGIGIAAAFAGIATAIEKIGTAAYKANRDIEGLNRTLAITMGRSVAETKEYAAVLDSLQNQGYNRELMNPIVGQIGKLNGAWDMATVEHMAKQYSKFANATGVGTDTVVADMEGIFASTKWDINDAAEQENILGLLYGGTANSSVSLQEYIGLLGNGDDAFRTLGFSLEEAIAYITSMDGSLEDVQAMIDAVDKTALMAAVPQTTEATAKTKKEMTGAEKILFDAESKENIKEVAGYLAESLQMSEREADAYAKDLVTSFDKAGMSLGDLTSYITTDGVTKKDLDNLLSEVKKAISDAEAEAKKAKEEEEAKKAEDAKAKVTSEEDAKKLIQGIRDGTAGEDDKYKLMSYLVSQGMDERSARGMAESLSNGITTENPLINDSANLLYKEDRMFDDPNKDANELWEKILDKLGFYEAGDFIGQSISGLNAMLETNEGWGKLWQDAALVTANPAAGISKTLYDIFSALGDATSGFDEMKTASDNATKSLSRDFDAQISTSTDTLKLFNTEAEKAVELMSQMGSGTGQLPYSGSSSYQWGVELVTSSRGGAGT